ncbi:MAG: carboxypeptidase regulatory-like domain-containing protein [Planctomycetota bacterium]|jgi:hypothetical protein
MRRWSIALLLTAPLLAQEETAFLVSGTVTSHTGKPVVASVHVFDALSDDRALARGSTDEQGNFTLRIGLVDAARRDHPFGPVRVAIHSPGLARAERVVLPGGRTEVKLGKAAVWAGIVKSRGGEPLPGAPVVAEQGSIRLATTSDENGRFAFADLGAGKTRITADATGYRAQIREGGPFVFDLEPLPLCKGTVVDGRTKEPLAGVHLVSLAGNAEAETDAEGRFAMEIEGGMVAAYLEGYAIGKFEFESGAIAMRRAPNVSGTVVNDENEPVAFARVLLDPGFGAPRIARTDASGAFEFPVGVTGFAFVQVNRRGYLPARATVDANWRTDRLRIALRKGRAIEGEVLHDGEPMLGAEVIFYRRGKPNGRIEVARAYSDAEGRIAVRALPPAAEFAEARFGSLRSGELAIERRTWFRLERYPSIAGIIRDDAGKPVAGLTVSVDPRNVPDVVTDAEGRFRFSELRLPEYEVVVDATDTTSGIRRKAPLGARIELVLERVRGPHRLALTLDSARAHPARVELRGPGWRKVRWLGAQERRAVFTGLATGTYQVAVDTPGYEDEVRDVAVAEDEEESSYALDLARSGTLRLKGTAGATVYIQTLGGEPAPVVSTRLEEGGGELAGFGPGRYRIIARAKGELIVIREIEVGEKDPPRELDLTGGKAATLRVRVTDGDRTPVRGVSITVSTPSGFELPIGEMTDEQGVATLSRLVGGSLTLVAVKQDRRATKVLEIKPGGAHEATLILE